MDVQPFHVEVPEAALADLRDRLSRTRWPDSVGGDWEEGAPVAYLRELADYWRERFDWRRVEARINAIPNFVASVDGNSIQPREWVERAYDVVRWTEMPRGGHFAAMEEPQLLAEDIREFFRPLRDR